MLTRRLSSRGMLFVLAAVLLAVTVPTRAETTLIEFANSSWRYLDDGSDAGTSWRERDFDDSRWKRGESPLGYGESEIRTAIDYGSDPDARPVTAYFRHTFEVDDPAESKMLRFLVRSDDGFVLYLNGEEMVRGNLPRGEITHTTTASFPMEGRLERDYSCHDWVEPPLKKGRNVVAVEVHQSSPTSDDLFFDLHLKSFPTVQSPIRGRMVPGARDAVYAYWQKHYVGPTMQIPDGYVDGGRGMKLDEEGKVTTYREVIVVDRSRDEALRRHLEFARSARVKALPPIERARELVRYINREIAPIQDPVRSLLAGHIYIAEHKNSEVLLGRVDYGVCRHRSLLFKMMSDESGLEVSLVRGNYRSGRAFGGHAWNELRLPDGRTVIVDATNPAPDLYFPATDRRGAERYLTVKNEPWYIEADALKPIDTKKLREIMRLPVPESLSRRLRSQSKQDLRKEVELLATSESGDENDADHYLRLSELYRRLEDPQRARETADKAIELYRGKTDSTRNRLILAKLYEDLDQPDKARGQVEAALKLEPNHFLANLALATLLLKEDEGGGKVADAYKLIMKASESIKATATHAQLAQQVRVFGFLLALAGQLDDAMRFMEQALVLDEDDETVAAALRILRE